MGVVKAAVEYYSKTSRTRQVALYIGKELGELGVQADVYEVRQVRKHLR